MYILYIFCIEIYRGSLCCLHPSFSLSPSSSSLLLGASALPTSPLLYASLHAELQQIHAFFPSFLYSFTHPFTHPFIHPFIHLFIPSFIHSFIHSFVHSMGECPESAFNREENKKIIILRIPQLIIKNKQQRAALKYIEREGGRGRDGYCQGELQIEIERGRKR